MPSTALFVNVYSFTLCLAYAHLYLCLCDSRKFHYRTLFVSRSTI